MTFAPKTLTDLMAYWTAQGGTNLGIVGDAAHQARATYHNGQDVITKYGRTAANDYSIRLARDREPYLTNAASAVDLGKLDGSLAKQRTFARWFAGQCHDNVPGYRAQVREVIFWSTVRDLVLGWSSLSPDAWIEGYGDGSHEWHAHISWFRDTEFRDKVALFSAYPLFDAPVPGEPFMPVFTTFATPKLVAVPKGGWLYVKPDLSTDAHNVQLDPGRDLPVSGVMADGTLIVGYRDATPTELIVPTYYVKGTVKDYPAPVVPPPPAPLPPDALACKPFSDAAVAADRLKAVPKIIVTYE